MPAKLHPERIKHFTWPREAQEYGFIGETGSAVQVLLFFPGQVDHYAAEEREGGQGGNQYHEIRDGIEK